LKWFPLHVVKEDGFRNLPLYGKFQTQHYMHGPTFHLVHWNLVAVHLLGCAHIMSVILQLASVPCVGLQGVSFGWLVGLVFFLGWKILNQSQKILSVVYLLPQDDRMI
jgi:hypothetical protein